jgi:hypothetical protein
MFEEVTSQKYFTLKIPLLFLALHKRSEKDVFGHVSTFKIDVINYLKLIKPES